MITRTELISGKSVGDKYCKILSYYLFGFILIYRSTSNYIEYSDLFPKRTGRQIPPMRNPPPPPERPFAGYGSDAKRKLPTDEKPYSRKPVR